MMKLWVLQKFCIHPKEWHQSKVKIGGTKNLHLEKIKSLNPDLVIANKEENLKEDIKAIQLFCPVWVSDINTYSEALQMMIDVSILVGKEERGRSIVNQIEYKKNQFVIGQNNIPKSAIYFIWRNPYMVVGKETFIDEMLSIAGFENKIVNKNRYPELSVEELISLNPEYILLSSEPYPFKQKHAEELLAIHPQLKIILADGELF
ncbi:MAG: periplasmic binding protein [Bacteroidetes bacterium OLB11]|nr:MAG: periplasmic binding protein [Bacteroidetes bacterium OLB11]